MTRRRRYNRAALNSRRNRNDENRRVAEFIRLAAKVAARMRAAEKALLETLHADENGTVNRERVSRWAQSMAERMRREQPRWGKGD